MIELKFNQIKALCKEYDLSPRELIDAIDCGDYSLMSYQDAETAAHDDIKELVWAFRASFLSGYTGLDESVFEILAKNCEDANDAVLSLIRANGGIEKFVEQAIQTDGLGHFLSSYDGEYFEVPNSDLIVWRNN